MSRTNYITRLVILISLTLIIEMIGLPQPVTGPLVNMMLILTSLLLNITGGVIMGCITPLAAVIRGQLPPFLLPMVPFVVIGNVLLVVAFGFFKNILKYQKLTHTNPFYSVADWTGLICGAFIKFIWLYFSATIILPVMLHKNLPGEAIALMTTPQLVTALTGGAFALFMASLLKRILTP
ncbi:ECF transporter S component [candidate division KSB1 bacterium]|nr:ECF transporter S component [candidate division KSB1 bacterium]